jgi:hypothetical protein
MDHLEITAPDPVSGVNKEHRLGDVTTEFPLNVWHQA